MVKLCAHCGLPVVGRGASAIYCSKKCGTAVRNKTYYIRHPEVMQARRAANRSDWAKTTLARIKSRAKSEGIPFNINREDIPVPSHCPVLGCLLVQGKGSGGWIDSSMSVDRLRPSLGYVKGNVRVISARANLLKSNASELELTAVLADVRRLQLQGLV